MTDDELLAALADSDPWKVTDIACEAIPRLLAEKEALHNTIEALIEGGQRRLAEKERLLEAVPLDDEVVIPRTVWNACRRLAQSMSATGWTATDGMMIGPPHDERPAVLVEREPFKEFQLAVWEAEDFSPGGRDARAALEQGGS